MTLVLSCTMSEPQTATITVKYGDGYYSKSGSEAFTMGALHDTGIGLDTLWLRPDVPGTWKLSVNELTRGLHRPSDTLQFRFFLADAVSDRIVGSFLKKEKELRSVALSDLLDENIVMEFGQPWQLKAVYPLRFEVNMSNQQVLGFFNPEEGDHVTVTGSWCGWCRPGVNLQEGDKGTWKADAEVRVRPGSEVQWWFAIETGRQAYLPNEGLERKREGCRCRRFRQTGMSCLWPGSTIRSEWCVLSLSGMMPRIVGKLKWHRSGKTTREEMSRSTCSYGLMAKVLRPAQKR